jgi:hypothetical protein
MDGFGTGRSPAPVISNTPSSLTAPKRFFTARTTRCAWCRSPSNDSTVSTTCSSTFGPARLPSLVTCAHQHRGNVLPLRREQELRGRLAHLADAAGRRLELDRENGLDRIDDHERRPQARDLLEDALETRFRQEIERRRADAEPIAAALDLVLRFLARGIEHGPTSRATCAAACSSSVDLPMPGSPPRSTSDPRTIPPPSTRSSSPLPLEMRVAAVVSTSAYSRAPPDAASGAYR